MFFECLLEVGYWSCHRLESERSIAPLASGDVYRHVWPSIAPWCLLRSIICALDVHSSFLVFCTVHYCCVLCYWGEPERAPHKRYFNAHSVYMYVLWYVRPSPARRFIDSALRPHAMFSAVKSAWSKQLRHSALI